MELRQRGGLADEWDLLIRAEEGRGGESGEVERGEGSGEVEGRGGESGREEQRDE